MVEVANPFTSEWSGDNDVFVVSLTESVESEFHWENYANGYTGFRLDFKTDVPKWKRVMDKSNLMLVRATYDDEAQVN